MIARNQARRAGNCRWIQGNDKAKKRILGKRNNTSKSTSASITSIYLSHIDLLF